MPALLARFQNGTFQLFDKHGMRCIAFWETLVGDSNQIHYILEWSDMGERQQRFGALMADPVWIALKSESERDGAFVEVIHNEFWRPVAFAPKFPKA
jgi:hypothetical protein